MNKNTFCVVPYLGGCLTTTGKVKACCQSADTPEYGYKDVVQWFTSDQMNKFREDLYKGVEHPWCKRCWDAQHLGQESLREAYNHGLFDSELKAIIQKSVADGFSAGDIRFLSFEPGNLCNLKCAMCGPENSSRILTEWKQNKKWFSVAQYDKVDFSWPRHKEFDDVTKNILPKLKYAKFAGGEPFLTPYVDKILEALPADCLVHVATNLTVLDDRKIELLQKFDKIWLSASIDAVDDLYEVIRYPAKWPEVEKNIQILRDKLPNALFNFSVTVSLLSILQIDKTLNTLPGDIGIIAVDEPNYMSLNAIPDKWMPKITERINNIKDPELRDYATQLLSQRKFSETDWQDCQTFIERISSIRNITIDMQHLVDS